MDTNPTVLIGKYANGRWHHYSAVVSNGTVQVTDEDANVMPQEWIDALPTVLTDSGRISITDDPQKWAERIHMMGYSRFGAKMLLTGTAY